MILNNSRQTLHHPGKPLDPIIIIVISRFLKRYLKAKRTKLFTSAATNQRGVFQSSGPNSRIPGGDRVAVKVGVVQMEKVNDPMGQGRSV